MCEALREGLRTISEMAGRIYACREGAQSVYGKLFSPIPPIPRREPPMADLKDSRAQSRLEKAARETGNAGLHYEVEAKAVREKIARLRALRMAKETAGRNAVVSEDTK